MNLLVLILMLCRNETPIGACLTQYQNCIDSVKTELPYYADEKDALIVCQIDRLQACQSSVPR